MNKADLTEALAERAGIPKVRAANYINILTDTIREALVNGEKVTISDFGTFTVSQRRQFTGHNPKNGEELIVIEQKKTLLVSSAPIEVSEATAEKIMDLLRFVVGIISCCRLCYSGYDFNEAYFSICNLTNLCSTNGKSNYYA